MEKHDETVKPVTLKTLRQSKDLRQSDVAAQMGVNVYTVILWEQGKKIPMADKFCKLAEIYGVDLTTLARAAGYIKREDCDRN